MQEAEKDKTSMNAAKNKYFTLLFQGMFLQYHVKCQFELVLQQRKQKSTYLIHLE